MLSAVMLVVNCRKEREVMWKPTIPTRVLYDLTELLASVVDSEEIEVLPKVSTVIKAFLFKLCS